MRETALLTCAVFYLNAGPANAQSIPVRQLAQPSVAFDGELTSITGIRELSDGRVIVLDARERMVHLFDPRTRRATRIGREGAGPGEYARPSSLVALGADTTLITDHGNNRFLVLGSGGRVLGTMPLVQLQPQAGVTYTVSVRSADALGRLYFPLSRGMVVDGVAGTPLIRFDRKTQQYDTVGFLKSATATGAPQRMSVSGGASFGMNAPVPFSAADDWAVAPSGAVAFVRASPYRIDWRDSAGTSTTGPTIPYERVKVGDAEKELWREQARARGGPTLTTTGADGRTQQQRLPVPEPATWPEYKAPFSAPAAIVAPDGRVWVARATRAGNPTTDYDVFDSAGRLVERVKIPSASGLVGFGSSTIYVMHKDEDDILRLQQHRLAR